MSLTNRRPAVDKTKPAQHIAQDGHVFQLPTYTMKQIHAAIPPHCFNPSTLRSMAYVARDALYFSTLLYASSYIPHLPNTYLRFLAWTAYTTLQGMIMTGIWILAHECGHGGFSKSKRLNDIMGLIMHSFLLVPYHSWRLTHAKHHKATGNLDKDTAFVPHTRESWVKMRGGADADAASVEWSEYAEDAPLVALWDCLVHQLLGWPGYLLLNLTGQDHPEASGWVSWVKKSHFWFGEDSALFKGPKETRAVALSDVGVVAMMVALYFWGQAVGSWEVALLFVIPWLWVNCWIGELSFVLNCFVISFYSFICAGHWNICCKRRGCDERRVDCRLENILGCAFRAPNYSSSRMSRGSCFCPFGYISFQSPFVSLSLLSFRPFVSSHFSCNFFFCVKCFCLYFQRSFPPPY
jgi:omega-6 fatty acid desaturase / acyl-lipid omega-6 desaturase (Delta-12 desaturase)